MCYALNGFMVRSADAGQEHLFKIKTPYYLVSKFLARLSENRIRHMFGNPGNFKQTVDEEFYGLVDEVTLRYTQEAFLALGEAGRLNVVRRLVQ